MEISLPIPIVIGTLGRRGFRIQKIGMFYRV
jgi:hypothetical protein